MAGDVSKMNRKTCISEELARHSYAHGELSTHLTPRRCHEVRDSLIGQPATNAMILRKFHIQLLAPTNSLTEYRQSVALQYMQITC